jgi:hypothetical protein
MTTPGTVLENMTTVSSKEREDIVWPPGNEQVIILDLRLPLCEEKNVLIL